MLLFKVYFEADNVELIFNDAPFCFSNDLSHKELQCLCQRRVSGRVDLSKKWARLLLNEIKRSTHSCFWLRDIPLAKDHYCWASKEPPKKYLHCFFDLCWLMLFTQTLKDHITILFHAIDRLTKVSKTSYTVDFKRV